MTAKEIERIRQAVRDKYVAVADSAEGKFKYQTGRAGAQALQYDAALLDNLDDEWLNAFCGVGNPLRLGAVKEGETVLDIGCGAGLDMLVAATYVGPSGRVCGIDLTLEMVERARKNLHQAAVGNVEVVHVVSEKIPYDDCTFGLVISNGVINLSPRKLELFLEIRRVLKPGGRLQFADIVRQHTTPAGIAASVEAWAQ